MLEEFNSLKSIANKPQINTCNVTISSCMRNQILQFYQPIQTSQCNKNLAYFFKKCSRKNYQDLELPEILENQWINNFVENQLNFKLDFLPVEFEYLRVYNSGKHMCVSAQSSTGRVQITKSAEDPLDSGFKVYYHKDRQQFKKLVFLFLDFHQSPLQYSYLINYYAELKIQLVIPDIQQILHISLKHLKQSFISELKQNLCLFARHYSSDFSVMCHGASSYIGCLLKNQKLFTGKLILLNPIISVHIPEKQEKREATVQAEKNNDYHDSFSIHTDSGNSVAQNSSFQQLQNIDSFGNSYISEAQKPKQFTIKMMPIIKLRTETFIANLQSNDIDMIIEEENETAQLVEIIDEVIQLVYQEQNVLQLFGEINYKPRKSLEQFQGITNFFRPLQAQIKDLKSSLPLMLVMCNARLVQNYMENMPQNKKFYKQIINFLFITRQSVTIPQNTIILVGSHNRFLNNTLLRKLYACENITTRTILGVGYDVLMSAFQTVAKFI
ncbi:hypothetical protein SS50377_24690 [Spironucleus salmonicida]|uniref:Uncharacterized protein n=1 Tax=Spironucleus salmonicida TaxID=348837 RepID=V6LJE3_9EUKA|nr:hypothetical protein SS50377_24690 [Spironucleus salmonicida]|eukprot:EST44498.1 Hypothetical protein SS50377_15496 [Spironucleus salmonicida]